jgi:hypothetical protein
MSVPDPSLDVEVQGPWKGADVVVILWVEEILHHLGWIKPYKKWDKPPINWCRISSIHSMLLCYVILSMIHMIHIDFSMIQPF